MSSRQSLVTVILPFACDRVRLVEDTLGREFGNPAHPAVAQALDETDRVHFMSLVVVPTEPKAHLLLEASVDGTAEAGLDAIAGKIELQLRHVLHAAGIEDAGPLPELLAGHRHTLGSAVWQTTGLDFPGTPGMSRHRIRAEADLARTLRDIVESLPRADAWSTLERAREALWERGDAKWAFVPEATPCLEGAPDSGINPLVRPLFGEAIPKRPFDPALAARTVWQLLLDSSIALFWPLWLAAALLLAGAAQVMPLASALLVVGALVVAAGVAAPLALRRLETDNQPDDREPDSRTVATIMARESRTAQNLLFSVSELQAGWLRRFAIRSAFFGVGCVGRFCRPGFLGANRVIHFARWLVIPGTDRLVFLSNYDGTWQGYVGDFVSNAAGAHGVSSIWSNCVGFPRTRTLVSEGALDRDRLERWARRQQRPVHAWYSGYPEVTTDLVRRNAAIRQGLASAATAQEARDWLACFGSMPAPAEALQTEEIPALAFGALPSLRHARMLAFRASHGPAAAREFVRTLRAGASYGEDAAARQACTLAFSASGVRALGTIAEEDLATFPVAFQQGMHAEARARANGDVDATGPDGWAWGGPRAPADILVLLHAETDFRLQSSVHATLVAAAGRVACVRDRPLAPLSKDRRMVEPFGFRDGVSQPALRGSRRARRADAGDVLAAGEFVLGYRDEIGRRPPSPTLAAARDPRRLLADAGLDPDRQRPAFGIGALAARRDLGANGTFLVVRELQQDVASFDAWLDAAASTLQHPSVPNSAARQREWLAAKLVGRWRDGTSLVRHPHEPGTGWDGTRPVKPDNDFRFGADDPSGMRCPMGAHVRRAHPRDGLEPGSREAATTVRTHRLLRVGRPYADANGGRGLLFMCVNSDIERQFEFVNQRWVLNPAFQALDREADALLGAAGGRYSIPVEGGCLRTPPLAAFVRTMGGGYFFVPSRAALDVLSA